MTPEEIDKEIETLVRDHGGRLRGYLRRLGLPGHMAEDVLTDALLAVSDKRRRGQPLDYPRAFLFRVARNAAIDQLKGLYAEAVPDSDAVDEAAGPDMLDAVEVSEDLGRAIGQLPQRQRQVIELRYLRDFSVSETAQILGIAEGTVGPTTTAALRNLRRIIEEQGGGREEETR